MPCRCWELKPGPTEEQPVILTARLFLQLWWTSFINLFPREYSVSYFVCNLSGTVYWIPGNVLLTCLGLKAYEYISFWGQISYSFHITWWLTTDMFSFLIFVCICRITCICIYYVTNVVKDLRSTEMILIIISACDKFNFEIPSTCL